MSDTTTPLSIFEIETFGRGGLAHYAHNLSGALVARGHDVTLVTAESYELEGRKDRQPPSRVLRPIGRATRSLRALSPGAILRFTLAAEAVHDAVTVAALARRNQPDIIHLHCTNPVALVYLALLRQVGRPLVYTAHVVTPHEPIPFEERVYRRIHALCDLIVAHSEVDRTRLLEEFQVAPDRVSVIPHGEYGFFGAGDAHVDRHEARRSLGVSPGDEVVLFFGYIREYKGLDLLLKAWPKVVETRATARLIVAGDPVQLAATRRHELETWVTRVGAIHRFEYIPFDDVARYFVAADAVVMPYRKISQSGVLFLAMSLGVPVVATRVGPLPELLHDGNSALLVPPESPAALSDALVRLLGDPILQRRLADGGRGVAAAHSWPAIAERTEQAFFRLVRPQEEIS